MQITRSSSDDGVLTLTMDDGNKNALDTDAFAAITAAFDDAGDARAIVLAGRPDIFSAGLNVKYMATAGRDGVAELLVAFGRTLIRVWLEPRPTVAACTGHALAAGTMLAMACDHAVAATGPHWWGLTETQIDFEMPHFGIALARSNVRADRLDDLILPGARIPADEAVEVGYADELADQDQVLTRAQARAAELAALPPNAYAGTKRRLRGMSADAVLAGLEDDIDALLASFPLEAAVGEVHWRELYHEVVDTGLCTGCAACVMACPTDVLGYTSDFVPFQQGEGMGHDQCVIGDRGCDICTRACPRFRSWESDLDQELFGRERREDEVYGIARSILLTRATDAGVHEAGQDGGLVSALLLWGFDTERLDGALVSRISDERGPFDSEPFLARNREDVLATAGSRYTYSANPLAMAEADDDRLRNIALVGMSCMASINGTVSAYGINKYKRKIALTLGLLCSKTFTYDGQEQVLAEHGIAMEDVVKINVKGRYMVWTRDGEYHEIPLKELHPHTRPGCQLCPDFAAEHADISTGGIGADDAWTLTIVRTERGEEWMRGVIDAGLVEARPGEDDEVAMKLLNALSAKSRKRWPSDLLPESARGPGLLPTV